LGLPLPLYGRRGTIAYPAGQENLTSPTLLSHRPPSPYPQVHVPAQGLLFWQLKITLLLPQNALQALSSSEQVAHFWAEAGDAGRRVVARRPQASASLRNVFFMVSSFRIGPAGCTGGRPILPHPSGWYDRPP
jgi:hypothetical protein